MGGIGIMEVVHEWSGLLVYWITRRTAVPFPRPMSAIPTKALARGPIKGVGCGRFVGYKSNKV